MSLLRFFQRPGSAPMSERRALPLPRGTGSQVLLSHERAGRCQSKLVEVLREEILAVIAKHVTVERDKVQVKMDQRDGVSTLAIEIELPASSAVQRAA